MPQETHVGWLFRTSYFGPDRRSGKFNVRLIERRRDDDTGSRETLQAALPQIRARGMRWVDHTSYFGPDRRSLFSMFFLERRKENCAGSPPPLHAALRQLRVRSLDANDHAGRDLLCDRLVATAILADAQGYMGIGDLLAQLAHELEHPTQDGVEPMQKVHAELNRAEAMQG
jgi:hypothetical protein